MAATSSSQSAGAAAKPKIGLTMPRPLTRQAEMKDLLSPRSNLRLKVAAARKLQGAFRRRRWRVLMGAVGSGAGGCFCGSKAYRPLVDAFGKVTGVRGPSGRWYVDRAFGCLSPLNPIRSIFILLIEASWFDNVILGTIIANCAVLALSGRQEGSMLYIPPEYTEQLELIFIATFTGELACKAVAMGIFTDQYHALLSEPWNRLDLLVVITAWLPFVFPELNAYTSLRALRAFRPLRAAHMLPGVRRQVNTLIKALPYLANVAVLILFIAASFAILGMQLFKGQLSYRCYAEEALRAAGADPLLLRAGEDAPAGVAPIDPERGVCSPGTRNELSELTLRRIAKHTSEYASSAVSEISGSDRHADGGCVAGVCLRYGVAPHAGSLSFDDFGHALMTVSMCITGEGWAEVMYLSNNGVHPAATVYFVLLTLFGSFYIVNLFLAVLWETYSSLPKELTPEEQVAQKRWREEHRAERHAMDLDDDGDFDPLLQTTQGQLPVWQIPTDSDQKDGGAAGDELLSSFSRGGLHQFSCRARLRRLVLSTSFRLQIMALILANTGMMMMERHPQPQYQTDLIEYGNIVFLGCYAAEMVLKLLALGCAEYWAEPFNRFDGFIVVISAAELITAYLSIDIGTNAQVLRAFRLARIFKIARSWDNLYIVIRSLFFTIMQLRDLIIVLLIFLFVCALLGMQLFGGRLDLERGLYDTIEHAMITVFIAITGEEWNDQWMLIADKLGLWTGVYYLMLVTAGDYIILNLVIAIVIREVGKADAYIRQIKQKEKSITFEGDVIVRNRKMRHDVAVVTAYPHDNFEESREGDEDVRDDEEAGCYATCARVVGTFLESRRDHALLIFPPGSCMRRLCSWLLRARIPGTPIGLEFLVLTTIVISSCAVALDAGCSGFAGGDIANLQIGLLGGANASGGTAVANAELDTLLYTYLLLALAISLVEIACKVVAFGVFTKDVGFLRSGWNQIDGFIAVVCVAELIETGLPSGLILRSIHVLRPIRLIARLPGLQKVVKVLYEVLPRVGNILLVYGLFQTVFAVLGVQLFAGKFGSCDDSVSADKAACLAAGARWQQAPERGSFDNFLAAALMLFEISSLEGWNHAMMLGIDAVGVDVAMQQDYNVGMSLFFILWVFLGGFVILNVFVGVLIDTFAAMENSDRFGGVFTSHQQQHWVETLEASTSVRPLRAARAARDAGCRSWLYRRVTHARFESLIIGVIIFNSLLMAADGAGISPEMKAGLDRANDVCTAIFVVEALLKLVAYGLFDYLSEGWNVFDLTVVVVALGEKAIEVIAGNMINGTLLRLVRLARAARVLRTLRMIKASRSIQSLLMTLLYSIPPLLNILSIFCILMFVYAVLGMELFSGVMWGDYLNADANFCSFGVAMLTMFRCATGEDWNGIMHDAMVTEERGCHPELKNCGSWMAVPFFVSYIILSSFVVLKMLIALIIENYKRSKREQTRLVHNSHRDAFVDAWAVIDPEGVGQIAISDLPRLIRSLNPPLGPDYHKGLLKERDVTSFIMTLDLVAYEHHKGDGKVVLFHDVLLALTTHALEVQANRDQLSAAHVKKEGGNGNGGGGGGRGAAGGEDTYRSAAAATDRSVASTAADAANSSPAGKRVGFAPTSRSEGPGSFSTPKKRGLHNLIDAACASNGMNQGHPDPTEAASFMQRAKRVSSCKDVLGSTKSAAGGRNDSAEPPSAAPELAEEPMPSVVHETNLSNLRAMFAKRARQGVKAIMPNFIKRRSSSVGAAGGDGGGEGTGPGSPVGRTDGSHNPEADTAPLRGEHDEEEEAIGLFSLSAEYAATVLQTRWREAKRRRDARRKLMLSRSQATEAEAARHMVEAFKL